MSKKASEFVPYAPTKDEGTKIKRKDGTLQDVAEAIEERDAKIRKYETAMRAMVEIMAEAIK